MLLILKIMAIVHSRQSRVSFDTSWLEDLYEQVVLETQTNKVSPLVINPGRVLLTTSRIYFQPYNNMDQVIIASLIINGTNVFFICTCFSFPYNMKKRNIMFF